MVILIADDEADIRNLVKITLEENGYTVLTAQNGKEAWDILRTKDVNLVILDVILCGQTGFDVCEWIKNNPETKDIIVFLFTALNQDHDYHEGQRVGCDQYLTKPQNPKDIVEKVNQYLNNRYQNQTIQ